MDIEPKGNVTRDELNEFLETQGITAKDFAELVGVSTTTMSRWRLGQSVMSRTSQQKVRQGIEATKNSTLKKWDSFLEKWTALLFPDPATKERAHVNHSTMTFVYEYIRGKFPSDKLSAGEYTTLMQHLIDAVSFDEDADLVLIRNNSLLRKDFIKFLVDEHRDQSRLGIVSAPPA